MSGGRHDQCSRIVLRCGDKLLASVVCTGRRYRSSSPETLVMIWGACSTRVCNDRHLWASIKITNKTSPRHILRTATIYSGKLTSWDFLHVGWILGSNMGLLFILVKVLTVILHCQTFITNLIWSHVKHNFQMFSIYVSQCLSGCLSFEVF